MALREKPGGAGAWLPATQPAVCRPMLGILRVAHRLAPAMPIGACQRMRGTLPEERCPALSRLHGAHRLALER